MKIYHCRVCGEERPEKFNLGYKGICRKCTKAKWPSPPDYYRNWYAKNGRKRSENCNDIIIIWKNNHPNAERVYSRIYYALSKGSLIRPLNCSVCNRASRIQAHHSDYDFPFQIIWVCSSCHKKIHLGKLLFDF